MSNFNFDDAKKSSDFIKKIIVDTPTTALVAGSGLGDIADAIENKIIIDASDVPNWPRSTAPGHAGKIIFGKIHERKIILLQGRVHYYEGYSMAAVTFPVRVLKMLGVNHYIATNASGTVNKNFQIGDVIAVRDHINFMGTNPLIGINEPRWNVRFPDMTHAYDEKILKILKSFGLKEGIYAAFTGPSYETPAEVKMARLSGADVVGMSTVPEVIVANSMKMKVAVLSCVANMAAGISEHELTEQEVIENMKKTSSELAKIIVKLIENLRGDL
ncbi:MAG: purine-nucleoside phosphorylase [Synergistaceae bacterium]|nr:purine-nucleoside phosphorylase [Synergistaceae bacterium]